MNNELKDPLDTFKRNQHSYFEDMKFGVGGLFLICGTVLLIGTIAFFVAKSLLSLFS